MEVQSIKDRLMDKKNLYSPRFWDIAVFGISLIPVILSNFNNNGINTTLTIIALIIAVIVTFINSQSAYDIESEDEFINDIATDATYMIAAFLGFGLLLLEVPLTSSIIQIIVIFMTVADFWVSLKGGASKLLEMDKANLKGTL